MTDDDLDRILRSARPHTTADDGWAGSAAGEEALAAVHAAAGPRPSTRRLVRAARRVRPFGLGIGFAAVAATVVGIGVAMPGPSHRDGPPLSLPSNGTDSGTDSGPRPVGPKPAAMALVGYDTCAGMLKDLREHAAAKVTPWGLANAGYGYGYRMGPVATAEDAAGKAPSAPVPGVASTPDHSTTNDQELGADEPDIVKNDGRRIVSVSGGVLRVVDAAQRKVTGTLDLRAYAGAESAQLLVSGDRALVLLGNPQPQVIYDYVRPGPSGGLSGGSTYLLVDLAATPTVLGTFHTDGGYVDARLIDGVVRVVVDNTPRIPFPMPREDNATDKQRIAANRKVVERAPLSAWLPTYQVSDGRTTTTHSVPCDRVSHPVRYSGQSMVTVYSFDPSTTLDDPHPVTVAADGATVYASASNLYVASSDGTRTQLHRFYVGGSGAPRYLGSGSVPGWLLNSYSLSEYDGALRVVTTAANRQATSLYVLDADTLRREGSVGGLGVGENLHAVRFLGPLAYVVTFESVDPLYVLDLHDPAHPRRAGELKVTGYSDYLHPTSTGRLLGVGQDVDEQERVTGLQVSLFDVSNDDRPTRLDVVVRKHTPSETPLDPHAFLYWPATRTAVIPIDSWEPTQSGAALVVRVNGDNLVVAGTIRNPAVATTDSYDTGIERTLVIGGDVWTMSSSGMLVSDLDSLDRRGWVPFS